MTASRYLIVVVPILIHVIAAGPAPASVFQDRNDEALSEEMKEAFARLDGLGFPDTKNLPFVRITAGASRMIRSELPDFHRFRPCEPRLGFMVAVEPGRFKVLTTDLHLQWFEKSPAEGTAGGGVACMIVDFQVEAERYLQSLLECENVFRESHTLGDRTEAIFLGRACALRGHVDVARKLCDWVRSTPHDVRGPRKKEELAGRSLTEILETEISDAWMLRAMIAATYDPGKSRAQLVEQFRDVVRHFPNSAHVEYATELIGYLDTMIEEDRIREARGSLPDDAPQEAKIADLIFQLRDERWHITGRDPVRSYRDLDLPAASPIRQLIAYGVTAVPQLIEAIDDERPSRSLDCWTASVFSTYQLAPVGSFASRILGDVSGLWYLHKEEAVEWWQKVQDMGFRKVLEQQVLQNNVYRSLSARVLAANFPDQAAPSLIRAFRTADTEDRRRRETLLDLVCECSGDEVIPFLLDTLRSDDSLEVRVAVARQLQRRGRREGADMMLGMWPDLAAMSPVCRSAFDRKLLECLRRLGYIKEADMPGELPLDPSRDTWRVSGEYLAFLIDDCGPDAIAQISAGLDARDPSLRRDVVGTIRYSAILQKKCGDRKLTPGETATLAEMEALLGARLSDTQGREEHCPSTAELAGEALALGWPSKYTFDADATPSIRQRQLAIIRNHFRELEGREPLPIPERPVISKISKSVLIPLLETLDTATSEENREQVRSAVLSLGLGALPVLEEMIESTPWSDFRLSERMSLADHVARIVRVVEIPADSAPLPSEVIAAVNALKGKPADRDGLTLLLRASLRAVPGTRDGFAIALERPGDGTGVVIQLVFFPKAEPTSNSVVRYGVDWEMALGGSGSMGSSGSDEAYTEFVEQIDRRLSLSTRETVEAHISYRREE